MPDNALLWIYRGHGEEQVLVAAADEAQLSEEDAALLCRAEALLAPLAPHLVKTSDPVPRYLLLYGPTQAECDAGAILPSVEMRADAISHELVTVLYRGRNIAVRGVQPGFETHKNAGLDAAELWDRVELEFFGHQVQKVGAKIWRQQILHPSSAAEEEMMRQLALERELANDDLELLNAEFSAGGQKK